MITLGIDPGTATTGYGFIRETDQGSLQVIDYGVIETPAKMPMEKRLQSLFHQLTDLILLYQPEFGAVEKLFFHKNVTTAMSVGQARGVIMLALAEAGIEVAEYTPLEIKQAVTGYGSAEKKQIQHMVQALLGLEEFPKPDDAADALAVAICFLHRYRIDRLSKL